MERPEHVGPFLIVASYGLVACLGHDSCGSGLRSGKRIVNRLGTGKGSSHFLGNSDTNFRELRNGSELNTDIRL